MSPKRTILAAVAALALAVPAAALAGHPGHGATYRGTSDAGDKIVFKVNDSGHHMFIKVTDPCDTELKGGGLTIGSEGRFDAISDSGAEVKGQFVSRRKATGYVKNKCRKLGKRDFVVLRDNG